MLAVVFWEWILPILLVVAAVGHAALCVYSHNWWYAQALPRRGTDLVQFLHGLALVGGPLLFYLLGGYGRLLHWIEYRADALSLALLAYVIVCVVIGGAALPVITIGRLIRPKAKSLADENSALINVTHELGKSCAGSTVARVLSSIPGNQIFHVELTEKSLYLPRLPKSLNNTTILHLSDLHFCGTPTRSFYRHVLERCAVWRPDILAITGDFVDSDEHRRWIIPLLGNIRWQHAAFAILGNHDQWFEPEKIRRRLAKLGIDVLGNESRMVNYRGNPLLVVGNEGPWFHRHSRPIDAPADVFRLCLSHTPDNMPWAKKEGIDLVLSGHVHGGQIRFPVIGSVIVPSRFGRRYDCGVFHEGSTVLHVSRGLGGEQPLRFNCPPEVTLLTLKAEGV